jgi:hypothetical protein
MAIISDSTTVLRRLLTEVGGSARAQATIRRLASAGLASAPPHQPAPPARSATG